MKVGRVAIVTRGRKYRWIEFEEWDTDWVSGHAGKKVRYYDQFSSIELCFMACERFVGGQDGIERWREGDDMRRS